MIGWLYQYFHTERKEETFALLQKNIKITKRKNPRSDTAVYSDWIVRYMVENSVGKLWLEQHPNAELEKVDVLFKIKQCISEGNIRPRVTTAGYYRIRPMYGKWSYFGLCV